MTRGGYIAIILLISLFWGYREYHFIQDKKFNKETVESLVSFFEAEKESFMVGKELIAQDVKEMKQLYVKSTKDLEFLKSQYKGFDRIQSVIKTEISSSVKNIKLPVSKAEVSFADSLMPIDIVNQFYIPKKSKTSFSDDWIDLAFTIGDSLEIDSVIFRNKFDAVVGWKKSDKPLSFLRKKEPVIDIISFSPYSKVVYANNITVEPENNKGKLFNSLISKPSLFIIGMIGGVLVTYKILK